MTRFLLLSVLTVTSAYSIAQPTMYDDVANKYKAHALSKDVVASAKMQGECLVQLKELTFKKKDDFDPISEWVNYRSVSLLQRYSPCEVLIMLEVANAQLRQNGDAGNNASNKQ